MLGYLLLCIAIYLYIKKNKRWSLLLFITFCSNGLQLLTDNIAGCSVINLAFIYTVIIFIYSFLTESRYVFAVLPEDYLIRRLIIYFIIFLVCSACFSLFYYKFNLFQVFRGGHIFFIILSYFFLQKTKLSDIDWIFQKLFLITFIVCVLYIIQVLTKLPVLPYDLDVLQDESTNLSRFYNYPIFLSLFLFVSVISPNHLKSRFRVFSPFVFILTIFLTQGRTFIFLSLSCLLIAFIIKGSFKKVFNFIIIVGICTIPFIDLVVNRLNNGGNTNSDLTAIFSGDFKNQVLYDEGSGHGTLSYRFAWVYERMLYLQHRPIGENIFGLGMISNDESVVGEKYHFMLGIFDKQTKLPYQLGTPDIAYGNLITFYGYFGGAFLLLIWIVLLIYFLTHKNLSPIVFGSAMFLILRILESTSGSYISATYNLVLPFLVIKYIHLKNLSILSNNKLAKKLNIKS